MSDAVTHLLAELVRIPSTSGNESSLADYVLAWLGARGVDAVRLGDNVVAEIARGRGARLMLNSHLDTVPASDGWLDDPFDVEWRDGRLVGLGANDAKASGAAMLAALVDVANEGAAGSFRGTLQLVLTACEETTNRGMGEVLDALGRPDMAVTGEPTGLAVVRTQAGLGVLRAVWEGRSCHAAHALTVDHENALLAAARALADWEPAWCLGAPHALIGPTTIVPTTFVAGERRNVVPSRAEAVFDVRLAPPTTARDAADALARRLPTARIEILSERLPPVETPADHPLVLAALRATGDAAAIGSPTLSDMALLAGVPAIKCGPGETRRSHTPNEFVTRDELSAAHAVYRSLALLALAT
ncbi:MAG: M20/M25/M40 family metallo-hydrolase [Planctomycetota bacterium]